MSCLNLKKCLDILDILHRLQKGHGVSSKKKYKMKLALFVAQFFVTSENSSNKKSIFNKKIP